MSDSERINRCPGAAEPVPSARVLVFDDLASVYGTRREFDDLVQRIVGTDFAGRWNLET